MKLSQVHNTLGWNMDLNLDFYEEFTENLDLGICLHNSAKNLEENIELTRREVVNPTAIEVELKKRLSQLTDHLIQKQTQVESLSSEKASLQLKLETSSRMLEEEKSQKQLAELTTFLSRDIESVPLVSIQFEAQTRAPRSDQGKNTLDQSFSTGLHFFSRKCILTT